MPVRGHKQKREREHENILEIRKNITIRESEEDYVTRMVYIALC